MTPTPWSFPHTTVSRVIDGDTVELDVDLGFSITRRASFRLLGINARELHEPGGQEAKANLARLLPVGCPIALTSVKADKYGDRYDAILTTGGMAGVDVATHLITTQWAAAWDGTGTRPLPPWPRAVAA